MPEITQVQYGHRELVELILRDRQITEGHWFLSVNFGFVAGNFGDGPGNAKPENLNPGAIVMIGGIGIQRAPKPNPMTVDASQVKK